MSTASRKGTVIVFDPVKQTITTAKLKHLGKPVIEQPTRRWQSHVSIYADARTEPESERRLVAALNLNKLGWSTKVKRLLGRRSQIYVMEYPRQDGSPISSRLDGVGFARLSSS